MAFLAIPTLCDSHLFICPPIPQVFSISAYDQFSNPAPFASQADLFFGVELWTWALLSDGSTYGPSAFSSNATLAVQTAGQSIAVGHFNTTRTGRYVLRLVDWRAPLRRTLYSDYLTYAAAGEVQTFASPFLIAVRPGRLAPAACTLVTNSTLFQPAVVPAVQLGIQMADVFGNGVDADPEAIFDILLSQEELGVYLGPVSSVFSSALPGYIYTFSATQSAAYSVVASRSDMPVRGSPASLAVGSAATVGGRLLLSPAESGGFVAGQAGSVIIVGLDSFGNDVSTTADAFQLYSYVAMATGDILPGSVQLSVMSPVAHRPGQYSAVIQPTLAVAAADSSGLKFVVRFGSADSLTRGPFTVSPGAVNASLCSLQFFTSSGSLANSLAIAAGTPITALITPRDAWGNRVTNATLAGSGLSVRVGANLMPISANGDGTFNASFVLTRSGPVVVTARVGIAAFFDAAALQVLPSAVDRADVSMAPSYTAGSLSSLTFRLLDAQGNALATEPNTDQFQLSVVPPSGTGSTASSFSVVRSASPPATVSDAPTYSFDGASGNLTVAFKIAVAGTLSLFYSALAADASGARWSLLKDPVSATPYTSTVLPGPAVAARSRVFGQCLTQGAITGVPTTLSIQARDAFDNVLTSAASGTFTASFSVQGSSGFVSSGPPVFSAAGSLYSLTFTPPTANTLSAAGGARINVSVLYSGAPVVANLSIALITEAGTPAIGRSVIVGSDGQAIADAVQATAGVPLRLYILITDKDGFSVPDSVAADQAPLLGVRVSPALLTAPLISVEGGKLLLLMTPRRAQGHKVFVLLEGTSTYALNAKPSAALVLAVAAGPTAAVAVQTRGGGSELPVPLSVTAGARTYLNVQSRDAYDNARSWTLATADHFSALLACPSGNISIGVEDLKSGSYELSFQPFVAGACTLFVCLGKYPVFNASVAVSAATFSPAHSRVVAPAALSAVAGQPFSFSLLASDSYGNPYALASDRLVFHVVAVSLDGATSVTGLQVQADSVSASYSASFTATVVGSYLLSVTEARAPDVLIGQAYQALGPIVVGPGPVDPAQCVLSGDGLKISKAGIASEFSVAMSDAYGNAVFNVAPNVTFWLGDVSVTFPISTVAASSSGLPATRIRFTPTVCTSPYSPLFQGDPVCQPSSLVVRVAINGVDVRGSPIDLSVQPADAPQLLSATMSDSLVQITAVFDGPTNRGGLGMQNYNCSLVLVSDFVSKLGLGPKCSFSPDATRLVVVLGSAPSVLPEGTLSPDSLMLAPNAVLTAGGNSYAALGGAPVQPPPAAFAAGAGSLNPVPVLAAPSSVGVCEPLTLDASASGNSGGRPLRSAFAIAKPQTCRQQPAACPKLVALQKKLAALDASAATLTLGRDDLDAGIAYVFSVSKPRSLPALWKLLRDCTRHWHSSRSVGDFIT